MKKKKKTLACLYFLPVMRDVVSFEIAGEPLYDMLLAYGSSEGTAMANEKLKEAVACFGKKRCPVPAELIRTLAHWELNGLLIDLGEKIDRALERFYVNCEGLMTHDLIETKHGTYWRIVGLNPYAYLARHLLDNRYVYRELRWDEITSDFRMIDVRALPAWLELPKEKRAS